MQRRSDSCSRWARVGLDRREGRNLMLRGVRALGRRLLRRTGADGGGFRRHLGRSAGLFSFCVKTSHNISTGTHDLFAVIRCKAEFAPCDRRC